eukprot:c47057_g1_i1 orf=354-803(-)
MDPLFGYLQHLMTIPDGMEKLLNVPAQTYVRDTKAMAGTPADVKEYADRYAFVLDMPGIKSADVKVQVENENVLTISAERKHDELADANVKYIRMERRMGKFMRKFTLPADANLEAITASCQDGVLIVIVPKVPPPEPKKPKVIEVTIA